MFIKCVRVGLCDYTIVLLRSRAFVISVTYKASKRKDAGQKSDRKSNEKNILW